MIISTAVQMIGVNAASASAVAYSCLLPVSAIGTQLRNINANPLPDSHSQRAAKHTPDSPFLRWWKFNVFALAVWLNWSFYFGGLQGSCAHSVARARLLPRLQGGAARNDQAGAATTGARGKGAALPVRHTAGGPISARVIEPDAKRRR